jgi:hypothetical protein
VLLGFASELHYQGKSLYMVDETLPNMLGNANVIILQMTYIGLPYFLGPTQDIFLTLLKSLNSLLKH